MKIDQNNSLREPSSSLRRRGPENKNSRVSLYSSEKRYEVDYIKIENLIPFKNQSRVIFDDEEISKLADTIRNHGIRNPLTIKVSGEDKYEIISGERRYRAAKKIGLKRLPCIVVENNQEAEEIALIENIHRTDLSPLELGRTFKKLLDEKTFSTQEEISAKLGIQRSKVVECVNLTKLPEDIQIFLLENKVTQRNILRKIIKSGSYTFDSVKKMIEKNNPDTNKISSKPKGKIKTLINIKLERGKVTCKFDGLKDISFQTQEEVLKEIESLYKMLKKNVAAAT